MKILKWMVGLLAAFVVLNVILYFVLAELGEVVVVDTGQSEVRLWVVDHDGSQWLRRGGGVTGWAAELGDEDVSSAIGSLSGAAEGRCSFEISRQVCRRVAMKT